MPRSIRNVCPGQRRGERGHTHLRHPFSKRKLSRKTVGTDTNCPGCAKELGKLHPNSLSLGKKFWLRQWQTPKKARLSILQLFPPNRMRATGIVKDFMQMSFSGRGETREGNADASFPRCGFPWNFHLYWSNLVGRVRATWYMNSNADSITRCLRNLARVMWAFWA